MQLSDNPDTVLQGGCFRGSGLRDQSMRRRRRGGRCQTRPSAHDKERMEMGYKVPGAAK
jgi:hypothetical protein